MSSTTRKATRVRIADAGDSIRRRESFVAGDGSLTGEPMRFAHGYPAGLARLPVAASRPFLAAYDQHGSELYVVRSYGTPVAWAGPGETLTVPDVRYSVTTSRHQGIARRADGGDVPVYAHKNSHRVIA